MSNTGPTVYGLNITYAAATSAIAALYSTHPITGFDPASLYSSWPTGTPTTITGGSAYGDAASITAGTTLQTFLNAATTRIQVSGYVTLSSALSITHPVRIDFADTVVALTVPVSPPDPGTTSPAVINIASGVSGVYLGGTGTIAVAIAGSSGGTPATGRDWVAVLAHSNTDVRVDGLTVVGPRIWEGAATNLYVGNITAQMPELTNPAYLTCTSSTSACNAPAMRAAIALHGCSDVVVDHNVIYGYVGGITFDDTTNVTISGNDIRLIGNFDGFWGNAGGSGCSVSTGALTTNTGAMEAGVGIMWGSGFTNVLVFSNYANGSADVGIDFESCAGQCAAYKNEVWNSTNGNLFVGGTMSGQVVFAQNYEQLYNGDGEWGAGVQQLGATPGELAGIGSTAATSSAGNIIVDSNIFYTTWAIQISTWTWAITNNTFNGDPAQGTWFGSPSATVSENHFDLYQSPVLIVSSGTLTFDSNTVYGGPIDSLPVLDLICKGTSTLSVTNNHIHAAANVIGVAATRFRCESSSHLTAHFDNNTTSWSGNGGVPTSSEYDIVINSSDTTAVGRPVVSVGGNSGSTKTAINWTTAAAPKPTVNLTGGNTPGGSIWIGLPSTTTETWTP